MDGRIDIWMEGRGIDERDHTPATVYLQQSSPVSASTARLNTEPPAREPGKDELTSAGFSLAKRMTLSKLTVHSMSLPSEASCATHNEEGRETDETRFLTCPRGPTHTREGISKQVDGCRLVHV